MEPKLQRPTSPVRTGIGGISTQIPPQKRLVAVVRRQARLRLRHKASLHASGELDDVRCGVAVDEVGEEEDDFMAADGVTDDGDVGGVVAFLEEVCETCCDLNELGGPWGEVDETLW